MSDLGIIGILALQGGYAAHASRLGQLGAAHCYVTQKTELETLSALIIPGGESTTMLTFLSPDFIAAIKTFAVSDQRPLFGTCAGAILMARDIVGTEQTCLNLIDMTVLRNAYGRQLASCIKEGIYAVDNSPMEMLFIRAPQISSIGKHVNVLATCDNEIVAVQENHCLAATFHPELTSDHRLHDHFLSMIMANRTLTRLKK